MVAETEWLVIYQGTETDAQGECVAKRANQSTLFVGNGIVNPTPIVL